MRGGSLLLAALAAVGLAVPAVAAGQAGTDSTAAPAPDPTVTALESLARRHARVTVSPHAHGTLVGVALRLPVGAAQDPPGQEGTAHLLARVRERQAASILDPSRAAVSARVERSATVFTLLATPEAWPGALELLDSLLFRSPVPGDLVREERLRSLASLRFEEGSPVRVFEDEAAAALVDPPGPWASPVRGTVASLEAVDGASLGGWSRSHLRPEEALLALAGPLPASTSTLGAGDATADETEPSPTPPAGDPGGIGDAPDAAPDTLPPPPQPRTAWRVGDRIALVQEVTSAWISVAWPAPDTLSRTALELLTHLVEEELDPVPPDPDRYSVEVGLVDTPGGPVLQVRASVLPESLARWERRILAAVAGLGERPLPDEFFRWKRRRFRTHRLLAEAAPEAEAARMARDLELLGRARRLDREVWGLDAEAVRRAAGTLGEPRILLLGPDLAQDGSPEDGGDPAR